MVCDRIDTVTGFPMRTLISRCLPLLALLLPLALAAAPVRSDPGYTWATVGKDGRVTVELYFFWSERCPHCLEARPQVEALAGELPWLRLHSLQVLGRPDNVARYMRMARDLGQEAVRVPAFLYCGSMRVGWAGEGAGVAALRRGLGECHRHLQQQANGAAAAPATASAGAPLLDLPVLGRVDPRTWSLPAFTVVLAVLDSFNPCAFFVLLFLLGLLVHAGSRGRMLVIGGSFILVSGLVYFLAMAAWLNLFVLVGHMAAVTSGAGLLAVLVAVLNIKDYFWFRRGPTLSLAESARPGLFRRMRELLGAGSLPAMLAAAVALALVANLYELICTAGFPMVYTRVLTLRQLPASHYYLYLLLYNAVYVLPLLAILGAFVYTLGRRRLQKHEGRVLKLLSGLMMLALGALLVLAPASLNNLWTALALLFAALVLTWLITRLAPPAR